MAPDDATPDDDRPAGGLVARQTAIRWALLAAIVVAGGLLLYALPTGRAVEAAQDGAASLGPWGPAAFGGLYVALALLLVSGAAMSVAAGTVFGPVTAFVTINLSAVVSGALAFLIGRYLARDWAARFARRNKYLRAARGTVEEGGFKAMLLLRISPLVPFTPVNYLLGATPAGFGPYLLSTWLGTMPGTLLYVYLGHLARAGLRGEGGGRTPQEWAYLGLGAVATVVMMVYLGRLAKRKLDESASPDDPETEGNDVPQEDRTAPDRWRPSTFVLAGLAALAVVGATFRHALADDLKAALAAAAAGKVVPAEKYEANAGGEAFDHSALDALLKAHVDDKGAVDYDGFKADEAKLDAYLADVAKADYDGLTRGAKLAYLLNAYNASTIKLILSHGIPASIKDIPDDERWNAKRFDVAGDTYSLNEIEHGLIRPNFKEPRIHFALVCAAVGCPPLRTEAYTGDKLDEQLQSQTRYVFSHDKWLRYRAGGDTIELTSLLKWYGSDFTRTYDTDTVLPFVARFVPALRSSLDAGKVPEVEYLDYDWSLNSPANVE